MNLVSILCNICWSILNSFSTFFVLTWIFLLLTQIVIYFQHVLWICILYPISTIFYSVCYNNLCFVPKWHDSLTCYILVHNIEFKYVKHFVVFWTHQNSVHVICNILLKKIIRILLTIKINDFTFQKFGIGVRNWEIIIIC